ncbi:PKD domain-containing protein [Burkholderia sp. MBR-1]|uniref:PKD domain-containing protein n=1 Tax=Burkholderia sp. MBR-1 TaxID=2732364 RepID=UPI0015EF11E9|nr:PKD domain-containing protein [Burkholderia sp. MBR-1]QMI49791.1 hypothetical protein MBR110_30440 [Burkholderia sp. MBR-1]
MKKPIHRAAIVLASSGLACALLAHTGAAVAAGAYAAVTQVYQDGSPPTAVQSQADVSGRVLVITGYGGDVSGALANGQTQTIVLRGTSGLTYNVQPLRTFYSADFYTKVFDDANALPSSDQATVINGGGWLTLIDTNALGRDTYTFDHIQITDSNGTSSSIPFANAFTFRVTTPQPPNLAINDANGQAVRGTFIANASGAFVLNGYPAQPEGPYTLTTPTMNIWGTHLASLSVPFTYQRPVVNVAGRSPSLPDFPGNSPLAVHLANPATSQPLVGPLPFTAAPLGAGTGMLNGVKLGAQSVTGTLPFDIAKDAQMLTASATVNGTINLYLNVPDAPNIALNMTTWNPADEIQLSPSKGKMAYTVDVAPFLLEPARLGLAPDCGSGVQLTTLVGSKGGTLKSGDLACAVKFVSAPLDAQDVTATSGGISGYIHDLGPNDLTYEPGVLYRDPSSGTLLFYSTNIQKKLTLTGTSLDDAAPTLTVELSTAAKQAGSTTQALASVIGNDQFAGQVHVAAPNRGLSMKITNPVGKTNVVATPTDILASQIYTSDSTLWDTQPFGFDVYYTRRPDKVWHTDLAFTIVPPAVSMTVKRPTGSLVSSNPFTLSGQLGVARGTVYTFDPTTMGDWRVQPFQKTVNRNANGAVTGYTLTPLGGTGPVAINADGTFTVNVGKVQPGIIDLVVQATLYRDGTATTHTVSANDLQLSVQNGNPIDAELKVAQSASGLVSSSQAYTPILNLIITGHRETDVAAVHWFVSSDGGNTWSSAGDTTAPALRPKITAAGAYQYKATLVDKYSQSESTSNVVTVEAFNRPNLSIKAPTAGFVGRPVTFTAVSDVPNTEFTWVLKTAYNDKDPKTASGPTFDYTPTTAGTLYVQLAGKQTGGTINNTLRTRTVEQMYSVVPLKISKAVISGPNVVETGKPVTFKVAQGQPFGNNQTHTDNIVGQWVLPDGTTQPGFNPLTTTVQPGQKNVSFESWVDGLQDSTQQISVFGFSTWTYKFPLMVIASSIPDPRAPATGVFTASYANQADSRDTGGEKFTFSWDLPPGASLLSERGNTITVQFTQPGEQQVNATISDTRGNSQRVASRAFTIAPAPTLDATMTLSDGDQWLRAPSDVLVKVALLSVPKGDTLSKVDYSLDGTYQTSSSNLSLPVVVHVPAAGKHTVSASITTKQGATAFVTKDLTLVQGDSPVCAIASEGTVTKSITLRATCTVKMGKVAGLKWLINGQPTALSSTFINFTAQQLGNVSNVTVIATTDKGQTGQTQWSK